MQIKALPNGAAAWHGAVPESRAGQCSEGYRSSTQAAAWKLNWNSWVPNTPGADLCEESSARRRPRAAVTAQTLKLNLTLDDKQEISHKCDPISSERTIQVHQTWTCSTHTNAVLYLQYSPKCRQTWGRSVRQEAGLYLEIKMTKYYTMFTPQTLRTGGVSFFLWAMGLYMFMTQAAKVLVIPRETSWNWVFAFICCDLSPTEIFFLLYLKLFK